MRIDCIPIFDSLTHPTLNGKWIKGENASLNDLLISMQDNNIIGAFAVGMRGIGDYHEDRFLETISRHPKLLPIAFYENYDFTTTQVSNYLTSIKNKGYLGIKIHPRLSELMLSESILETIIRKANDLKLVVLFCTYFIDNKAYSISNNYLSLRELLVKIADCKIILLHGGTVNLLEFIELTRSFPNILLDLSFTICKYPGSSLDLDLKFAFKFFDKRICIGSDHPEFSYSLLRNRFDYFSEDIDHEKKHNIAYKNLIQFINEINPNINIGE
jgi:predicted TIM-barrel fold metal-dependent hydrolase